MNIINITLGVDTQPCSSITLGRRGENEVTQVVVDFSSWVEEFGAGVITLLAMRSQDTSAYPVVLSLSSNTATWDVTSTDTAYKGSGRAEFIYTVGEQIAKSVVFNTVVMQDIGEPSETPPDPYEDWLERLTELGAETQANAEAAQQSAEDAEQSAQEAAQEATNAEGYAEQAGEYASAAQSAEAASESARDEAQTAQASAESSATAASGSAASAAGSATAAAGSASDASASATAAGASATTASTAATQAEAAKTAAQNAQSAAEDAAADAQQAAQQAHVEYEQLSGEVDDLDTEVSRQKSALTNLSALVDCKAGALIDTASGSIASFVPDATIPDLLGLTVDIEPVQDLNGYDNPWPAGGGANLFDKASAVDGVYISNSTGQAMSVTGAVSTDYIHVNPNTSYYIINDATSGLWGAWYDENKAYVSGISGKGVVTSPSTAAYMRYTVKNNASSSGSVDTLAINYPSTITTYSPYSNICPISGWDAVEVERTGKNLLDVDSIGEVTVPASGVLATRNGYVFEKEGTYTVKANGTGTSNYIYARLLSSDGTYGTSYYIVAGDTVTTATITVPSGSVMLLYDAIPDTLTVSKEKFVNWEVQVEVGNTASAYEAYDGISVEILLGQTVYGGTLDATAGTLTVDRAIVAFDGTESAQNQYFPTVVVNKVVQPGSGDGYDFLNSHLPSQNSRCNYANASKNSFQFSQVDTVWGASSADELLAIFREQYGAGTPVQICYPLATPITITLDPVTISTISGQTNNVWADAGDVSVEFAADLKHYIDSKIAAAVAALS